VKEVDLHEVKDEGTPLYKIKKYYVYILECADGSLYTGITNNLERRLKQHNDGKGAKYCKNRRPVKLVFLVEAIDKSSAAKEEYRIKQLKRIDKLKLINNT
jgi:putative endonuclease